MYLLDTNVISELRKLQIGKADARVEAWAQRTDASDMYLSVITVMESEIGILSLERRDVAQATALRRWFDEQVLPSFQSRVLPIDTAIARCAAGLHVPNRQPERDSLIAATAIVNGMTVITRNGSDFERTGVPVLDPWRL